MNPGRVVEASVFEKLPANRAREIFKFVLQLLRKRNSSQFNSRCKLPGGSKTLNLRKKTKRKRSKTNMKRRRKRTRNNRMRAVIRTSNKYCHNNSGL